MALTDTTLRNARPRDKAYKLNDGKGLLVVVNPNGSKLWRLRYEHHGRENMLSFGAYPDISLSQARKLHADARQLIAQGIDPARERAARAEKRRIIFKEVADEWLHLQRERLTLSTQRKARWMLDTFVYPQIGSRPIVDLRAADLLTMLRRIEEKGLNETAKRTKQRCSQIFRYAISTGRAENDPTVALRGALAPVITRHHAGITEPAMIGELMHAIDGYTGHPIVTAALKLSALTFVRPGELQKALWSEIDLPRAQWRISAERMKMREEHIVPLAPQAIVIIRDLASFRDDSKFLLPSIWSGRRPISENTVNLALRRLGFTREQMTAHGFRTTASTQLNELGYPPDVIELQLAHRDRNKVRASYNMSLKIGDRHRMMCDWADYLDSLRTEAASRRSLSIESAAQTVSSASNTRAARSPALRVVPRWAGRTGSARSANATSGISRGADGSASDGTEPSQSAGPDREAGKDGRNPGRKLKLVSD